MGQDRRGGGPPPKAFSSRRRLVRALPESVVRVRAPEDGAGLPLLAEPEVGDLSLPAWLETRREWLEETLWRYGAVLFRGFAVETAEEFAGVTAAAGQPLLNYDEPSTRRTEVGDKVYTSTEYPSHLPIPLHNELSYSASWPARLYFFCSQPAEAGGETPIADSRKVYRLIDDAVREKFERKQVMYVRNYGGGVGLSWQTVFRTDERARVEDYCRAALVSFEWRGGDRLRTRQVRPAVARHPRTGETVWFNQAHVHHVTSLAEELRPALLEALEEGDDAPLDINAFYGDSSAIEPEALDAVRRAYDAVTVPVAWRRGDVLVLDNVLAAHGRNSFSGPRKILVVMTGPAGG